MAIYHKYLQRHADDKQKHSITPGELHFLKELQKEINTQDNVGQANPRFWVIKGSVRQYGIEDGYEDGSAFYYDGETIADSIEGMVDYINEEILEEINDIDGVQRSISVTNELGQTKVLIEWEEEEETYTGSEFIKWLGDMGYDYNHGNYTTNEYVYPNTMFLSQQDAEDHLRANHYHYSEDAHTYAMTAWRSPRVEKLIELLQTVDFEKY